MLSVGGTGKYPSFGRGLWPKFGASFAGIDFVEGVVDALSVAHIVEYEELRLRAKIARIGAAGALEVGLGLLGDIAGVAAIRLTGQWIPDVANQDQRRCGGVRIGEGRRRIRDDQHVAFLDLLEAADR